MIKIPFINATTIERVDGQVIITQAPWYGGEEASVVIPDFFMDTFIEALNSIQENSKGA